jgi:Leucine-rich repeat (LRR) protein
MRPYSLEWLDLRSNQLAAVPAEFSQLTALEKLHMVGGCTS